jgi:hypothetical protein
LHVHGGNRVALQIADEHSADVGTATGDRHGRPLTSGSLRRRRADALRPTVNEHDLVVEQAHRASLPTAGGRSHWQ